MGLKRTIALKGQEVLFLRIDHEKNSKPVPPTTVGNRK